MDGKRRRDPDEDRINAAGTRAKCRFCGEWYGLDEYHGDDSPRHIAWRIENALEGLSRDPGAITQAKETARSLESALAAKIERISRQIEEAIR